MKHAVAALILIGVARSAFAHPLDVGYLRIDTAGRKLTIALDLEVTVAGEAIGASLDEASVRARAIELAGATYRLAPIVTDAGPCAWTTAAAELKNRTVAQIGEADCPEGASTLRWEFPFIAKMPATFQLLVKARSFAGERVAMVDKNAPRLELSDFELEVGFGDFVWSGIEHIGAAPSEWIDEHGRPQLPDGIDHLLFLLALLLGGGTMLRLAGIATGFTLGHSVTLALAAFGVLRPPASVIEPLIALTIAATAVEAFLGGHQQHRWKIATAFGLIHGFAFASALTELELAGGQLVAALFGYNLGVELGQLVFVLAFSAPLLWLRRKPELERYVVRGASAVIFICGIYWFLERTL